MDASAQPNHVYRFGLFRLDPTSGTMLRKGIAIRLQDQPFRALCLLLEQSGEIVSREALRQAIWPCGTCVEFDTNLNTIMKRLRSVLGDEADNPIFIETIPKRGYRFIAPLECERASGAFLAAPRPDVLEANAEGSDTSPAAASDLPATAGEGHALPTKATRFKSLRPALALGLPVVMAAGVLVVLTRRSPQAARIPLAVKAARVVPRPAVAIMELVNVSGRPEISWLGTAIPEMLRTELAAGGKLRVIPGGEMARMQRELHLRSAGTFARITAVRVGKYLNASTLLAGSYVEMGPATNPSLRIDLRVQDAATGEVVAEFAESGPEKRLFDLISDAGTRVRERLGVPEVSEHELAGARDLLERAIAAEPAFPLSHSALASAWSTLGYDEKARAEAKKAFDLSGRLPLPDRLLIEGRYHAMWDQRARAVPNYRALFTLFPDSVDDGLLLAQAQSAAQQPNAAFDTLESLRALPTPLSDDPRIDMAEAHVFATEGDFKHELEALERARRKARAQGLPLLAAKAELGEWRPLNQSGHPEEAMRVCREALPALAQAGDRDDVVTAEWAIGTVESGLGRLPEALDQYAGALKAYQAAGDRESVAVVLNNMAVVYELQGELKQAERFFRGSHTLFVDTGDRDNAATTADNIGETLIEEGKLAPAEKLFQHSLDVSRENGARDVEAGAPFNLASVAFMRGRLDAARQFGEQAAAERRKLGAGYDLGSILGQVANTLRMQGDSAQARRTDAEALAVDRKSGAKVLAEEARLTLAEMDLDLDDGHAAQAEPAIRQALLVFAGRGVRDDQLRALAVLARCLVMEHRTQDAEGTLDQGRALAGQTQNPASRLRFAIAEARVKAARASDTRSLAMLKGSRSELLASIDAARRLGFVTLEYRARLALAEAQVEASPAGGQRVAASLAQEARTGGFGLVAKRAAALLESRPVGSES
jgi:DNA-binding winged helix-turn-helix (wHTH) protein/tetratricopeptide (TPR) repeat protein